MDKIKKVIKMNKAKEYQQKRAEEEKQKAIYEARQKRFKERLKALKKKHKR